MATVTYTVTIEKDGRKTDLFIVKEDGRRFEIDNLRLARGGSMADLRVSNAVMRAISEALEQIKPDDKTKSAAILD